MARSKKLRLQNKRLTPDDILVEKLYDLLKDMPYDLGADDFLEEEGEVLKAIREGEREHTEPRHS